MTYTTHTMRKAVLLLGLAVSVVVPPVPAFAQDDRNSVIVDYGDLNLNNDRGLSVLDRRLRNAVEQICGRISPREVFRHRSVRACKRVAWNGIEPQRENAIARARRELSPTVEIARRSSGNNVAVRAPE
jgi:UrcA family protein